MGKFTDNVKNVLDTISLYKLIKEDTIKINTTNPTDIKCIKMGIGILGLTTAPLLALMGGAYGVGKIVFTKTKSRPIAILAGSMSAFFTLVAIASIAAFTSTIALVACNIIILIPAVWLIYRLSSE